jgi:hypothetical protein
MNALLRSLIRKGPKNSNKARTSFRPALEGLEDRTVPTVTFHGGAVLQNVRVQALFLGSQWLKDPALTAQAQYLSGSLSGIVNSSYMDALTNAGYGVGRGTVASSMVDPSPAYFFEQTLTADIANKTLQNPTANTLYVLFEAPNVSVRWSDGSTSATVGGGHGSFQLRIPGVVTSSSIPPVRYVAIAYPGGSVGNVSVPSLSTLDSITTTLSREIADAVTDPDLGYYDSANSHATRKRGWYDGSASGTGEVGDVVTNRVMYVNGYALQRVVNQHDLVMTPATATSNRAVNFVLQADGTLLLVPRGGNAAVVASGIAALSDQGIDNQGHAFVDVVTTAGLAAEIHDTGGMGTTVVLGVGVKSAKAGQGVSYIQYNNGDVYESDDATAAYHRVTGSATQIDAGTDAQGVNAVDVIIPVRPIVLAVATGVVSVGGYFIPFAYQYSDDGGARFIASGVKSVSAGRQGFSAYVTTAGEGWAYNQAGNRYTDLGSGVSQVTAGTDESGYWLTDILLSNGALAELGAYRARYTVATGVKNVSKARLGAVDLVLTPHLVNSLASTSAVGAGGGVVVTPSPVAWEHTLGGWRQLGNNAAAAV